MTREFMYQLLPIEEWPLKKEGDERFFGYVVALGVCDYDPDAQDGMRGYVDFSYGNSYTRYELPDDESLKRQLFEKLRGNISYCADTGSVYEKVWITRRAQGYSVEAP
jgi:hypothetical protein